MSSALQELINYSYRVLYTNLFQKPIIVNQVAFEYLKGNLNI